MDKVFPVRDTLVFHTHLFLLMSKEYPLSHVLRKSFAKHVNISFKIKRQRNPSPFSTDPGQKPRPRSLQLHLADPKMLPGQKILKIPSVCSEYPPTSPPRGTWENL